MGWFDFLALILASGAVLEVWFKGSLFATPRAVMQDKDTRFWTGASWPASPEPNQPEPIIAPSSEPDASQPWWLQDIDYWIPDFVGALLSCAFCFSYHAPFWLGLVFWVPSLWLAEPWNALFKFPIYCLAATRAGNILTGLLPAKLQYENADELPDADS